MGSTEELYDYHRARTQREVNSFALFMFAWNGAYSRPSDTLVFPQSEDMEAMARYAIRHFLEIGEGTSESLQPLLDVTMRAVHARFFFLQLDVKVSALDEVRSLIAEELGYFPAGMELQS